MSPVLYVWDGTAYVPVDGSPGPQGDPGIIVSPTAPPGPHAVGTLWLDSDETAARLLAADIPFTPVGSFTATDVQAALAQAAPIGAYALIAEVVTTAGQSPVTFNNIPQTFRHLKVEWVAKGVSAGGGIIVRFNNIATATYDWVRAVRHSTTGAATLLQVEADTNMPIGGIVWTDGVADGGAGIMEFPHYASSFTRKTGMGRWANFKSTTPFAEFTEAMGASRAVTPISRLDLLPNFGGAFAAGSIFSLYGIG